MTCNRCGSSNVTIQLVNETHYGIRRRSIIWWIFIGWWFVPLRWLFFFTLSLVLFILKPIRKRKITYRTVSYAVCQRCGNSWPARP